MTKHYILLIAVLIVTGYLGMAQQIIPKPAVMQQNPGKDFVFSKSVQLIAEPDFAQVADLLADLIEARTGIQISVRGNESALSGPTIALKKSDGGLSAEAYSLQVSERVVTIVAAEKAGSYYGGMTLLQLLEADSTVNNQYRIAPIHIQDMPRFSWRGLMLDCSRTFISVDYLKKTIDRMSFYKLNTLHLHLTDDQGWRLEVKSHPNLTTEGAFFADNYNEPEAFQGYYSQQEIEALIDYAALRQVTIIPEIEVPGHSSAAIHAYPHLSCSGRKVPIFPLQSGPPAPPNDVFCAGNDSTYLFFEQVLDEVTQLFPAAYVHLGGDEVPKHHWRNCHKCQAKMKALNINTEEDLQGFIMDEVSTHLASAGKQPIAWDEILEGEIAADWVIMAWRGHEKGIEAAKRGHQVVMTPTSHLYFDYSHVTTPTKKVYAFEPISDTVAADIASHFIGIQANFWSHVARTESRIDFQLFPRTLALAERAWSEKQVTDYEDFEQRKQTHADWLKFFDIKYNRNDNPEPSPWDVVW